MAKFEFEIVGLEKNGKTVVTNSATITKWIEEPSDPSVTLVNEPEDLLQKYLIKYWRLKVPARWILLVIYSRLCPTSRQQYIYGWICTIIHN